MSLGLSRNRVSGAVLRILGVRHKTDIEYYRAINKSHLHEFESQSTKRKFLLKLEKLEKMRGGKGDSDIIRANTTVNPRLLKDKPKIDFPKRIPRGPTDILRAICAGLKRDISAPDYRFVDDPFLIPYNSFSVREYVLSKESGKKAARFVFDKHPELFEKNLIEMEPPIKSFMPKIDVRQMEPSIESLEMFLEGYNVSDAIEMYNMITEKGEIEVPKELKLKLLETLSYYAESEATSEDAITTLGCFTPSEDGHWKTGGLTEQLVAEIKGDFPLDSRLALLKGYVKHGKVREAEILLDEMKNSDIPLTVHAYNAAIEILPTVLPSFGQLRIRILEIFKEMAEKSVKPNMHTLVAVLKKLSAFPIKIEDFLERCQFALSVLSEFKTNLDIKPSLTAYAYLLRIVYPAKLKTRSPRILYDIIDELSAAPDKIRVTNPEDLTFLREAMFVNGHKYRDVSLAYQIHDIAMKNEVLLNNLTASSSYYESFLFVLITREPFDVVMEFYNKFTPHVFQPRFNTMIRLIDELNRQGGFSYLPSLWMDLVANNFCRIGHEPKIQLIHKILTIAADNDFEHEDSEVSQNLIDSVVQMAEDCFSEYVLHEKKHLGNPSYPPVISTIIRIVLTKRRNLDFIESVIEFVKENDNALEGPLDLDCLDLVVDACVEESNKKLALNVIAYASQNNLSNAIDLVTKVINNFELTKGEKAIYNSAFSHHKSWSMLS